MDARARNKVVFEDTLSRAPEVDTLTLHITESSYLSYVLNTRADKNFAPVIEGENLADRISIENRDCVMVARDLVESGAKVCMLNMASAISPGGGVVKGASAQEEHLCRTSNLYLHLKNVEHFYPLPPFDALYTMDVEFIKDGTYTSCKPFKVDVVSVAAYRLPKHTQELTAEQFDGTKRKIRTFLGACHVAGMKTLVLSALGCGAFHNPPQDVARAFKEVLLDEELAREFTKIVFAIIEDHNSGGVNGQTFKNAFTHH